MSDDTISPFDHAREMANAKRDALEDLQQAIEGAGYSAYVTEFHDEADDEYIDTFEVSFTIGLSAEQHPDR